MTKSLWALALIIAMVLCFGQIGYTKGYVAVIVNTTPTESSHGVLAEYERNLEDWLLESDGQLQYGLQTTGLANLSIYRGYGDIGIKPYAEFLLGPTGLQQDYGFVGNFKLSEIDVSIGGSFRNADPVTDTGIGPDGFTTRPGYNPETGKWKDSNTFSFEDTQSLNLIAAAKLETGAVETAAKISIPVKSFGENTAYPQVITRSQVSAKVGKVDLKLIGDLRLQLHKTSVEYERAISLTAGITF